jgi:hypothetical protein
VKERQILQLVYSFFLQLASCIVYIVQSAARVLLASLYAVGQTLISSEDVL